MPRSRTPASKRTCEGCGEKKKAPRRESGDYLCDECDSSIGESSEPTAPAPGSAKKPRAKKEAPRDPTPTMVDVKAVDPRCASGECDHGKSDASPGEPGEDEGAEINWRLRLDALLGEIVAKLPAGTMSLGEAREVATWLGIQELRATTVAGGAQAALLRARDGRLDVKPVGRRKKKAPEPAADDGATLADELGELRKEVARLEERNGRLEAELGRRELEHREHAKAEDADADRVIELVSRERDQARWEADERGKKLAAAEAARVASQTACLRLQKLYEEIRSRSAQLEAELADAESAKAAAVTRAVEDYALGLIAGTPKDELVVRAVDARLREVARDVDQVRAAVEQARRDNGSLNFGEPGTAGHPLGDAIMDLARAAYQAGSELFRIARGA